MLASEEVEPAKAAGEGTLPNKLAVQFSGFAKGGPPCDGSAGSVGSTKPAKSAKIGGAPSPGVVTHALSFKGATIAWAILRGHKIIENRPYRLPTDGWIAVHVGKGKLEAGEWEVMRRRLPCPGDMPDEHVLLRQWSGAIVGCMRVLQCRRPENCDGNPWVSGPVCNVVGSAVEFATPVAVPKGALSLWSLDDAARGEVRARCAGARIHHCDISGLPPFEEIRGPISPPGSRKRKKPSAPAPAPAPAPLSSEFECVGYQENGQACGFSGAEAAVSAHERTCSHAAARPTRPAAAAVGSSLGGLSPACVPGGSATVLELAERLADDGECLAGDSDKLAVEQARPGAASSGLRVVAPPWAPPASSSAPRAVPWPDLCGGGESDESNASGP